MMGERISKINMKTLFVIHTFPSNEAGAHSIFFVVHTHTRTNTRDVQSMGM